MSKIKSTTIAKIMNEDHEDIKAFIGNELPELIMDQDLYELDRSNALGVVQNFGTKTFYERVAYCAVVLCAMAESAPMCKKDDGKVIFGLNFNVPMPDYFEYVDYKLDYGHIHFKEELI